MPKSPVDAKQYSHLRLQSCAICRHIALTGEATEYFYDVNRCGGIEVGKYIDYAWHAYDSGKEVVQIIEPWDAEHPYS